MNSYNEKTNEKTAYFNGLAPDWDSVVGNDKERIKKLDEIFERIALRPGDRVLDVGSGNGVLLPLIHKRIGDEGAITALDAAQEMLNRARELYPSFTNVRYVASPVEDISDEAESYDVVLAFAVIPHVDDIPGALKKIRELLSDNGRLYIFHLADTASLNDFHSHLDAPVHHDMLPERDEMKSLLRGAGFDMPLYLDEPGLNFIEALPCTG